MKKPKLAALVFGRVFLGGTALIIVSLVVAGLIFVISQPTPPIVTGNYTNTTGITMQDIGVALQIWQNDILKNEYRTKLKKDGSFRVKVKERGQCHVLIRRFSYYSPPLFNPILSNKYIYHPCFLEEDEVVDLGTHYLFESLQIISPSNESNCMELNELYFEWEEVPFANVYRLDIEKVIDRDGYQSKPMIRSLLLDTKASYRELQALKVDENADDVIIEKIIQPFNVIFKELGPGCYEIYVNAYKYDADTEEMYFICESNKVAKNYLFNVIKSYQY